MNVFSSVLLAFALTVVSSAGLAADKKSESPVPAFLADYDKFSAESDKFFSSVPKKQRPVADRMALATSGNGIAQKYLSVVMALESELEARQNAIAQDKAPADQATLDLLVAATDSLQYAVGMYVSYLTNDNEAYFDAARHYADAWRLLDKALKKASK